MPDIVYVYIVSLVVGLFVIFFGFSYLISKKEDDTEDDLGYLGSIILEEGGAFDE